MKRILVIDIGGTHVKLMITRKEQRKFDSGPRFTAKELVRGLKEAAKDLKYDAVSIGFPAPVRNRKIMKDPKHLGAGWVGWNPTKSLGKPARMINDAAMQALGSYRGGRMLFLGLGTGLGSALVWAKNVLSLELGDLPYPGVNRIEDRIGLEALKTLGREAWQAEVIQIVRQLKIALIADYIVLGGGNVHQMNRLPEGIELGDNRNAFLGGCRLWETDSRTRQPKWRVI